MGGNPKKALGCGVGLRSQHYPAITQSWPAMDFFEAISENYMDTGGRPHRILEQVRSRYPVALHGTALSIGSSDPLNEKYLERLKRLADSIEPFVVSDHLCWSGAGGQQLHDLLPLPFTEEVIRHVVSRVQRVQETLGRQILLENVSTYVTFKHSVMPEWEFVAQVARRSGCGILLDLNNVYVNSVNHGFDPYEYLRGVPADLVSQFHLAGHTDMGSFLFDTHSRPVIEKVWDLYREALRLYGPVSTLIEWDEDIPPYEELAQEAAKARIFYRAVEHKKPEQGTLVLPESAAGPASGDAPPLAAVQESIRAGIQPDQTDAAPKVLPGLLNPQGGAPGEERLGVYAGGYPARIREALSETFEAVHHVLGDGAFEALCRTFARRHGGEDYNLNYAGEAFEAFIGQSPLRRDFPFLPDLARLEWALWQAFHAFDQKPMSLRELSGVPLEQWESARIEFQPSVRLVQSPWPVLDIWRSRKEDPRSVKINLKNNAQRILVGRKEDQVRCELLDAARFKLLRGLLGGLSLGDVCQELADASEAESLPLDEWFAGWVRDGLIVSCELAKISVSAHNSSA